MISIRSRLNTNINIKIMNEQIEIKFKNFILAEIILLIGFIHNSGVAGL